MINRNQLIDTIHNLIGENTLATARDMDDMANGVQIAGSEKVSKVAVGVSLNQQFLEQATSWGAEFCIFHHGIDTRTYKSLYSPSQQLRLRTIFNGHLTITAYHAALDIQPQFGNNTSLAKLLQAEVTDTLFHEWGLVAKLPKPTQVKHLATQCENILGHTVLNFGKGNTTVQTLGICTGSAKPYSEDIFEMLSKGVQLFITGETSEWTPHNMIDSNINYFVCGHYATEAFGVKNLGEKLTAVYKNKLIVKFIDVPNPI